MPGSVLYALTITLQPKLYKYKPEEQYDKTYLYVGTTLKALGSTVSLIAELTKTYNIHYHAMIKFDKADKCVKKLYDSIRGDKYIGYIMCKQVTDDKGWKEYIEKDLLYTRTLIDRPPIIMDEFDCKFVSDGNTEFMQCFDLIDEQ